MGSCAGLWPLEYWKVRNWQQNKLYESNRRIFDLDYYRHCRAGYGIDESKEAMETVGGAFWSAVFVATYYGVRYLSS
jgi:hypothetical protein